VIVAAVACVVVVVVSIAASATQRPMLLVRATVCYSSCGIFRLTFANDVVGS
jgi:hypothetical protein